jgi:hypothetical protein
MTSAASPSDHQTPPNRHDILPAMAPARPIRAVVSWTTPEPRYGWNKLLKLDCGHRVRRSCTKGKDGQYRVPTRALCPACQGGQPPVDRLPADLRSQVQRQGGVSGSELIRSAWRSPVLDQPEQDRRSQTTALVVSPQDLAARNYE